MENIFLSTYHKALTEYKMDIPFDKSLRIVDDENVEVFYSPFDHINTKAKIVIVGISPGATQAHNANAAYKAAIESGLSVDAASKQAKLTASFSGALRNNLIALMDYIGCNKRLGIDSTESLFAENAILLHSTSALRYPTLIAGKPISSAKRGLKNPFLKNMVDSCLSKECAQFGPDTLFVPLGQGVAEILNYLADQGILRPSQVLVGLPHPSGANAERINYFLDRKKKSDLSNKTNPDKLDTAKRRLMEQLNSG